MAGCFHDSLAWNDAAWLDDADYSGDLDHVPLNRK